MADFVQESGYTYRACGKTGPDSAKAVGCVALYTRVNPENLRLGGTDPEVRKTLNVCRARQICAVEEAALAEGE
jgi:hypothetical protein